MKKFLDTDFLLTNDVAAELYHNHAAKMPIIDYHNHLSPEDIANNRHYKNITEAWLEGDHYKWRAMRANGIDENFITGDADPKEKFSKWAETVPYTLRNPLYHWTHLELQRYFGENQLLNSQSGDAIYQSTSEQLQQDNMGCQGLLIGQQVKVVCTTDDPIDSLEYHKAIAAANIPLKVLPTFRPDKALNVSDPKSYNSYLDQLANAASTAIKSLSDLLSALQNRVDYFDSLGCKLSDLGFNTIPMYNRKETSYESYFETVRAGQSLSEDKAESLQAYILLELCKMYHAKGWAQQFHLGALRNNNARALRELGPDTGYDSMGDFKQAESLSTFLNKLDDSNQLAKTILYNLNPSDNELFATMVGNFNDGQIIGKMQFGTGWWFLDQKTGMINQMNALSNMGLLSRFIGMLTDSRSFLSFPRHEYFRRILCDLIGQDVVNGEIPHDMDLLGEMIENISYNNANTYFGFDKA